LHPSHAVEIPPLDLELDHPPAAGRATWRWRTHEAGRVGITPITVRVLRPGPRAEELLAAVAQELGIKPSKARPAVFMFHDVSAANAHAAVARAMAWAGPDADEHLHLGPPAR
jgi:hypothetical protein